MTGLGDQTDLIKQAQTGDRAAFEALLSAHYDVIFRIAFKWCGNRVDAEDIAQDACIKLARSIDSFRFQSDFVTWLYRLVINTAKDWTKARAKHPTDEPADTRHQTEPPAAEDKVYASQVMAFVRTMPAREQAALLLVFGQELSHREAATVMECKESTVSWYIHEARKKLRTFQHQECRHG